MATVESLVPGDFVTNGSMSAVFIARTVHPLWPELQLVVWRLIGEPVDWSHDALSHRQDVGTVVRASPEQRITRLRAALLGRAWLGGA